MKLRDAIQSRQTEHLAIGTLTGGGLGLIKGAFPERAQVFGVGLPSVVFGASLVGALKFKKHRNWLVDVATGSGAVAANALGEDLGKDIAEQFD